MPLSYGTPPCPNAKPWKPRNERCPRSDTYRATENGNVHAVWGWRFRCRTCETTWFVTDERMKRHAIEQGARTKAMEREARKT